MRSGKTQHLLILQLGLHRKVKLPRQAIQAAALGRMPDHRQPKQRCSQAAPLARLAYLDHAEARHGQNSRALHEAVPTPFRGEVTQVMPAEHNRKLFNALRQISFSCFLSSSSRVTRSLSKSTGSQLNSHAVVATSWHPQIETFGFPSYGHIAERNVNTRASPELSSGEISLVDSCCDAELGQPCQGLAAMIRASTGALSWVAS